MAKRRMFNRDVVETDWFTDMPATTQLLYIHLSMEADDDGFVTNTKTAMVNAHASKDDLAILKAKNYLMEVEDGLYLFKHWKQNNYIQKDRYQKSPYLDRLEKYELKDDGSYTLKGTIVDSEESCIQNVSNLYTQVSIGKDSIGNSKVSIGKDILTDIKQDKTVIKQSTLCETLAQKGFISEDDLQDPCWDNILDEMVQEYGYVPTKIALNYILDTTKIKHSYAYLRSALINNLNRPTEEDIIERMEEI